jgi:zinc/manganese transport system substrate-binding protein
MSMRTTGPTGPLTRVVALLSLGASVALIALIPAVTRAASAPRATTVIQAVGAENEYADVIKQIGGAHVAVTAILSDPNADPHSYESSTRDAAAVSRAAFVVQNGLGYDAFMQKLEAASPSSTRVVLSVGESLGFKAGDNPHIWYDPTTMPYVAAWASAVLTRLDPADSAGFQANLRAFDASMLTYTSRIAALRRRYAGTPVAITEPVFGYALNALDFRVLTPPSFALAIQEGNDPAPQDVQTEENLLSQNKVKLFAYNQQAVAPITVRLLPLARAHHIPIVGIYETKPLSKSYQQWMVAELDAVDRALGHGQSTEVVR